MLVKYIENRRSEWDTVLDSCVFAYNTSKNSSTLYSPFEVMYGRKAILPVGYPVDDDDGKIPDGSQDDLHVSHCTYNAKFWLG